MHCAWLEGPDEALTADTGSGKVLKASKMTSLMQKMMVPGDEGRAALVKLVDAAASNPTAYISLHRSFFVQLGVVVDGNAEAKVSTRKLKGVPCWGQLQVPLKAWLMRCLEMIRSAKEGEVLLSGLDHLGPFAPLLTPFPTVAKAYVRLLLSFIASADDLQVLEQCFNMLQAIALEQPLPCLHHCFKGLYFSYRECAGRLSPIDPKSRTPPSGVEEQLMALLRKRIAAFHTHEKASSYRHCYVYIRELVKEAEEAKEMLSDGKAQSGPKSEREAKLRHVRGWEYIQAVRLMAAVVARHHHLKELIPPVVQLLELLATKIASGPSSTPYQLMCVSSLQEIAAGAGVFVPTSYMCCHTLRCKPLLAALHDGSKGRPSKGAPLKNCVHLTKNEFRFTAVQTHVMDRALNLLEVDLDLYQYNVAFPEYSAPAQDCLKEVLQELGGSVGLRAQRSKIKALLGYSLLISSALAYSLCDTSCLYCPLPWPGL
ncbi:unnamed protein product [Chrysoparadoxa australica]